APAQYHRRRYGIIGASTVLRLLDPCWRWLSSSREHLLFAGTAASKVQTACSDGRWINGEPVTPGGFWGDTYSGGCNRTAIRHRRHCGPSTRREPGPWASLSSCLVNQEQRHGGDRLHAR